MGSSNRVRVEREESVLCVLWFAQQKVVEEAEGSKGVEGMGGSEVGAAIGAGVWYKGRSVRVWKLIWGLRTSRLQGRWGGSSLGERLRGFRRWFGFWCGVLGSSSGRAGRPLCIGKKGELGV